MVDVEVAYIRLLEGDLMVPRATTPSGRDLVIGNAPYNIDVEQGGGIAAHVMANGEPLALPSISNEPRIFPGTMERIQQLGLDSAVLIPLKTHE